jgi:hypothetical protein
MGADCLTEPSEARAARLEENRRKQARAIGRRLREEENRRLAELLTWWVSQRKEQR